MTTDWVSSSTNRMVMPPTAFGWRARKRVTGTEATSRSSTLTPAALIPAIIARLSMRAERDESRDVTTVDSFFKVVEYASASRTASSGLTSTFASPATPSRPKSVRAPRDSQTIELLTTADVSTVLNGYTLTPAPSTALSPTK